MRSLRRLAIRMVLFISCLVNAPWALAGLVVVASSQSPLSQLTRDQVVNIYMGGNRKLPDGSSAHAFEPELDSAVRRAFYHRLLDKSVEEINAYWARLVFSGRTQPPVFTKNVAELLERVSKDPHAIGYLDQSQLPRADSVAPGHDLKILFVLPD
jgi:ABC-type phosphate transport system substrate-binding protein